MTRDRMFGAFLAAGAATIAAGVYTWVDPTLFHATLVLGWKIVFLTLAVLLLRRGPLR